MTSLPRQSSRFSLIVSPETSVVDLWVQALAGDDRSRSSLLRHILRPAARIIPAPTEQLRGSKMAAR